MLPAFMKYPGLVAFGVNPNYRLVHCLRCKWFAKGIGCCTIRSTISPRDAPSLLPYKSDLTGICEKWHLI